MKRIFLTLITVLLISGAAWGQVLPTSPTSTASRELFTSDADNFIDPSYYTDVNIEKAYIMSSFADNTPSIGYATKLGGIYLGLFYRGNLRVVPALTYVEEQRVFPYTNSSEQTVKNYNTSIYTSLGAQALNNNLAVLIGVADMGFALYFNSTLAYFNEGDIRVAGTNYKSYEASRGNLMIGLGWGMAKDLTENGIRPWARLRLSFNNDFRAVDQYQSGILTLPNAALGRFVQVGNNYTDIMINAGMGEYIFKKEGGLKAIFDIDLYLRLTAYDNEYSWYSSTTTATTYASIQTDRIQGLFDGTNLSLRESGNITLTPSVGVLWESEKIDLGAKFFLIPAFTFNNTTTHWALPTVAQTDLRKDIESEAVTFTLYPRIALGTQVRLIPEKLSLVAGGAVNFSQLSVVTTDERRYANNVDNNEIENSATTTVATSWAGGSTGLYLGLNFNLTKNVSFEAMTGVSNSNNMNIFGIGGGSVSYFTNILLSIKF
ncbi:MAG: hypothetical protein LBU88_08940 [Treponema sp.]|jgi:hypothetical protein|nr:hypothetical protein [Treponema sp.]